MLGAIIGDIVGSTREWHNVKSEEFELLPEGSRFTDDTVMTLAVARWLMDDPGHTPDGLVSIMQVYGRPIYISIEERNRIADADLSGESETLQEQRDIFVFQCQTRCRVSDLLRLTPGNVQNGILEYVPSKTSHGSSSARPRVPLTPRAMSIVEKYRDNKSCRGRLLPFISSQKYNQMIKEIFKIAGVTRKVNWRNPRSGMYELRPINEIASSHMARRTFVGNAYKMTKDPALIGYMSGHTPNSRSFQRYRDIDDDDLKEVIGKIE